MSREKWRVQKIEKPAVNQYRNGTGDGLNIFRLVSIRVHSWFIFHQGFFCGVRCDDNAGRNGALHHEHTAKVF